MQVSNSSVCRLSSPTPGNKWIESNCDAKSASLFTVDARSVVPQESDDLVVHRDLHEAAEVDVDAGSGKMRTKLEGSVAVKCIQSSEGLTSFFSTEKKTCVSEGQKKNDFTIRPIFKEVQQ